jgi:hypothetical protein
MVMFNEFEMGKTRNYAAIYAENYFPCTVSPIVRKLKTSRYYPLSLSVNPAYSGAFSGMRKRRTPLYFQTGITEQMLWRSYDNNIFTDFEETMWKGSADAWKS